ncbi:CsgG/HfaB family protein [Magnetococcus sp. PR-3]|uniref:CsgG/HfaB family protein n=1 Tax=Magnetococcus sp. PR-3 TaxID=3120355 RepID=UPI002FCDFBD0
MGKKQNMKIATILLALLGMLFMSGCGTGTGRAYVKHQQINNKLLVAVLPFENLSNNPNGGLIVSQFLATELYHRQLFQQMEETELRRLLTQNKVDVDRLSDVTLARKVGLMLGVDAVILGSVAELSYQHGLREEPAVGFNVQLLRIEDGVTLWRGSQSLTGSSWLQRQSLSHLTQKAVIHIVEQVDRWYHATVALSDTSAQVETKQ